MYNIKVTIALQDETVQPKESAWHLYWSWGDNDRSKIMNFNETDTYKHDLLGLRTLGM